MHARLLKHSYKTDRHIHSFRKKFGDKLMVKHPCRKAPSELCRKKLTTTPLLRTDRHVSNLGLLFLTHLEPFTRHPWCTGRVLSY
jgi:hypothetical protein